MWREKGPKSARFPQARAGLHSRRRRSPRSAAAPRGDCIPRLGAWDGSVPSFAARLALCGLLEPWGAVPPPMAPAARTARVSPRNLAQTRPRPPAAGYSRHGAPPPTVGCAAAGCGDPPALVESGLISALSLSTSLCGNPQNFAGVDSTGCPCSPFQFQWLPECAGGIFSWIFCSDLLIKFTRDRSLS